MKRRSIKKRFLGVLEGLLLVGVTANTVFAQGPPINTNTAFVVGLEGAAFRTFGKVIRKSSFYENGKKITDDLDRQVTVLALPVILPYEVIPNRLVMIGAIPYLNKEMKLTNEWEGDTLVNIPNVDYEGTAPDMGAHESPYSLTTSETPSLPSQSTLHEPYPNPFNSRTTVEFSLLKREFVRLTIYDLAGREVSAILNRRIEAGHHIIQWNARAVPSGVFFMRMEVWNPSSEKRPVFSQHKKLVLLK